MLEIYLIDLPLAIIINFPRPYGRGIKHEGGKDDVRLYRESYNLNGKREGC